MSELAFTQARYSNFFNDFTKLETKFLSLSDEDKKQECKISCTLVDDMVLSYPYSLLSNLNILYSESIHDGSYTAIKKFTNTINTTHLSIYPNSFFTQPNGFFIHKCPVVMRSSLARDKIEPDVDTQNDISTMYIDALQSDDLKEINLGTETQLTREIPYIVQQLNVNNVINSTLRSSVIHSSIIYQFLQNLASILENLKIFKYTYNFKITNFSGKMELYNTTRIFPDLPINTDVEQNLVSYYSAVLVSPFARYYDIRQSSHSSDTIRPYASQFFKSIFTSDTVINLADLSEEVLIYIKDNQSDIPTFNIASFEGSNGIYTHFKKITTNTYNLHDLIPDVVELFSLKSTNVISAKKVFQAIQYIVDVWHTNIQVYQCDVYACHYNCHANNLNGATNIERAIFEKTYTIKCVIDADEIVEGDSDEVKASKEFFNTNIYPYLTLDSYQTTYLFQSLQDYNTPSLYDRTEDAVDFVIPWPHYTGTYSEEIVLTCACIITDIFPPRTGPEATSSASIYVHDGAGVAEQKIKGTTRSELQLKAAYYPEYNTHGTLSETVIDQDTSYFPGTEDSPARKVIKGIGNFEFHFGRISSSKIELNETNTQIIFFDDPNSDITITNSYHISTTFKPIDYGYNTAASRVGQIYYDLIQDSSMATVVDLYSRGISQWSISYKPHPVLAFDCQENGYIIIPKRFLDFNHNNDNIIVDIGGPSTVYIAAKVTSPYHGTLSETYTNNAAPKLNLNDPDTSKIYIDFEDGVEPSYQSDYETEWRPTIVCREIQHNAAGNPITWKTIPAETILNIEYSDNINPGRAKVTISPTRYGSYLYGESYYWNTKELFFTITRPPDDDRPLGPGGEWIRVGPYYVDWGSGEKWYGTVFKDSVDCPGILGDASLQEYGKHGVLKYRATRWVIAEPPSWNGFLEEGHKYKLRFRYQIDKGGSEYLTGVVSILYNDIVLGNSFYCGRIGGHYGGYEGNIAATIDTTDNFGSIQLQLYNLSKNYDSRRQVYLWMSYEQIS